jgi:hypothetical protein
MEPRNRFQGIDSACRARARIFKLLRSTRIDSKEPIPPRCMCPGGPVQQPFSYSVPRPHGLFKNSSTGRQSYFYSVPSPHIDCSKIPAPCSLFCTDPGFVPADEAEEAGEQAGHPDHREDDGQVDGRRRLVTHSNRRFFSRRRICCRRLVMKIYIVVFHSCAGPEK